MVETFADAIVSELDRRMSEHGSSTRGSMTPGPSGRGSHYDFGVDLGNEPPLDADGGDAKQIDRREVSLRWLVASVLTGLVGAALLGAAIYVSLDGETTFAERPERVALAGSKAGDGADRAPETARKGDKLVQTQTVLSAKQSFRAAMTTRSGDREVIKVRPFVRIATGLSLTSGVHASDIPAFNPLRLFAAEAGERTAERFVEAPPENGDADVSVVKRSLSAVTVGPGAPGLSDDDVIAQIEEERRLLDETGRRPALPMPAQLMLSRTLRQGGGVPDLNAYAALTDTPFNAIEVRVVPENVTTLAKIEPRTGEALIEEREASVPRGETLDVVLRANGANADQARAIVNALGARARNAVAVENQQMRLLIGPGPRRGDPRQIVRVILFGENGIEGIAAQNDRGTFVSVAPPTEAPPRVAARPSDEEDEDEEGGVRLYESLYETILKHDLPRQTVEELIRIFGYDVDFQRRVGNGDAIELFYADDEETSERLEILSASLTVGGETRRVFRFLSPEDGSVDYFDGEGRSLKKFLLRKPVAEGELRSGFGYRRHPVLGYSKMHTGVDWANRIGTPIVSSGNGTVIKAEWDSGYGRRIEIQHVNGYVTSYSHLSRFARGIQPGARVRQGQVIGFVGNTGLSTGPHLHYEVVVNGHFVDPMKIRLPRGRELDGRALADFRRQREQVEALLERAPKRPGLMQRDAAAR